jgi:peptidoglycan/xylan/chitin deacetylase (PgdA/CDA1 family)
MYSTRRFVINIILIFTAAILNYDSVFSLNTNDKKYDGKSAVILCFHDINGGGIYSIKEQEFIAILNQIKNKYEVYSLKTWYEKVANGESFSKPPLVLTFDDGYASIFTYVIPTLKKYNFGATFFIYLERFDKQPWLFKEIGSLPDVFEIGSHSFSHTDMAKIFYKNRKQFYREIFLSRKKLEFLIGKPVISWAWPYGSYNKEMVEMAKKAGYSLQVTTDYKNTTNEFEGTSFSRYTIQNPDPVNQAREILLKNSFHE